MGFVKKLNTKKIVAIAMAFFMVVGLVPTSAKAALTDEAKVAYGAVVASSNDAVLTACQSLTKQDKTYAVGDESFPSAQKSDGVNNGFVDTSKARVFGVITATKDSKITLAYNAGKASYVFASETDLGVLGDTSAPTTFAAADAYVTLTIGAPTKSEFEVEAGKFYYIAGVGTNVEVIDFVAETITDDSIGVAEDFLFIFDENKDENGVVKVGEYKFGDSVLLLSGETVDGVITNFTAKAERPVVINGKEYLGYRAGKRHADANFIYAFPGVLPDASKITGNNIDIDANKYGKDGREVSGLGCLMAFTPAASGMVTVYFNSGSFLRVHEYGADGQKTGEQDSATNITSYSFEVIAGKKYVMSTTGKTNEMYFAGIEYVANSKITVPVTVKNIDATVGDGLKLSIIDAQLGGDPIALKTDATSVKLLNGHTYKIATNDGGVAVLINGKETFVASEEAIEVQLKDVPDVELTGKIVGADASTVSKLTFTGMTSGATFEAVITGDTYKVTLKPGEYNTAVVTTNGGFTKDRASVKAEGTNTNDVYVEVADPASYRELSYEDIANLPIVGTSAVENGKAHFVGKTGDTLTVPVTGKGTITVTAYYTCKFTVNGQEYAIVIPEGEKPTTSKFTDFTIDVDGDTVLTFAETSYITKMTVAPDAAKVPFKSEIKVPGDYATFNDAVAAINNMADRPAGEAGRVTITLTADIQEQVNMTASYVTLKGEGHTISWYYGVATKYYSVDPATGLYNKRLALDRYSSAEGNGNLWGGAFICRGDNFIAENTIFKNTYNYELTEAEKTDIAGTTLSVSRLTEGADVTAYAYKERSNAFYVEADNIELYNCQILSSQDTFGRNGSANNGYHVYLKDCVIGGNTDYICGEFTAIFDNCELQWKTFKNDANNNGKIGFIVAPKTSNYVFRNCKVTTDGAHGEDPVLGKFGRTWGSNSTATFINTETNGFIGADGWTEMNTGEKASAVFNEFNNTNKGEAFASTGANNTDKATVIKFFDADDNKVPEVLLNSWVPVHYSAVAAPADETPTPTPTPVIPVTGETIPFATVAVLLLCVAGAYMLLRRRFAK